MHNLSAQLHTYVGDYGLYSYNYITSTHNYITIITTTQEYT